MTLASNPGRGRKAEDTGREWEKMKRREIKKDNEERNEDSE